MEEENMKKIICILLTVFLLASMSTAAFAKIKAGEPVIVNDINNFTLN